MSVPYLAFQDVTPDGRKTLILDVCSVRHGDVLGQIRWFGRWRQYAFFPAPETVWNPECLDTVNRRVRSMMEARRARG